VVVGLDAELDELSVGNVVQCEDTIVFQSRALLPAGSEGQIQQELDDFNAALSRFHVQARLVVLERVHSLALYFICMTLSALLSLRDQWTSGELRDIVQSLFTFLACAEVRLKRLTWPLDEYERSLEFFGRSSQGGQKFESYTVSQKGYHPTTNDTFDSSCAIETFLVQILLSKYALERWFNIAPHLFIVCALPWETLRS